MSFTSRLNASSLQVVVERRTDEESEFNRCSSIFLTRQQVSRITSIVLIENKTILKIYNYSHNSIEKLEDIWLPRTGHC